MNNTINNIGRTIKNTTITVAATVAGATVTTYAVRHDVMNDIDQSCIVGAAGGALTFCAVKGALNSVVNGTCNVAGKIKTKLNSKSKKGATT